jgi:hypothetical protein
MPTSLSWIAKFAEFACGAEASICELPIYQVAEVLI